MSRVWFPIVTAIASWLAGGCKCDANEKPYTPFGQAGTNAAEPGSSGADVAPTSTAPEAAPFTPRKSTSLSPPAGAIEVSGTAVRAPEGWLIQTYLSFEPAQAPKSVVAWLVPEPSNTDKPVGALWQLDEKDSTQLHPLPAFVPSGPECKQEVTLTQTGVNSLALDVAGQCSTTGIPRAPTRSLIVLAMESSPRKLVELRLASAAPGETLDIQVDSRDRDGDGHDDAAVTFTVSKADSDKPSAAPLIWLDRASGAARDPSEPTKSFTDIGSIEKVRAGGANTAKKVPERIDNARRLFAYLCERSGTYRVTDADGRAIDCGKLGQAFTWYVEAEVTAWLKQKQWAQAVSALDRANWYGGPPRSKAMDGLKEAVRKALPAVPTRRSRVSLTPREPGPQPRLSPLSFDGDGSLLVQTVGGISRVRDGEVSDASEEVDPWTLVAFNEAGKFVTGLSFPCDETRVAVSSRSPTGMFEQALETDLLPPRPGACAGQQRFAEPTLRVVAWLGDNLHAFVGPLEYGRPEKPVAPRGSPLSPDARSSVSVTSLGLLVNAGGRSALWTLGSGRTVSECVVANGATQVACIEGSEISLFSPHAVSEAPSAPAADSNANN